MYSVQGSVKVYGIFYSDGERQTLSDTEESDGLENKVTLFAELKDSYITSISNLHDGSLSLSGFRTYEYTPDEHVGENIVGRTSFADNLTFINNNYIEGNPIEVTYSVTYKAHAVTLPGRSVWNDMNADFALADTKVNYKYWASGNEIRTDESGTYTYSFQFDAPIFTTQISMNIPTQDFYAVESGSIDLKINIDELPDGVSYTSESGVFLRSELDAPKNIIILTHGWQPGSGFDESGAARLPGIRAALEARLEKEGVRDETLIMEFHWPEAYGAEIDFSLPFNYDLARAATKDVGGRLAAELETYLKDISDALGENFNPNLHFIGHSLGTMVNAYAINGLTSKAGTSYLGYQATVQQATMIDTPFNPEGKFGSLFKHEDFFHRVLNTDHLLYLENFYASNYKSDDSTPRFGQAIDGAGPIKNAASGGLQFKDTDHTTIRSEYALLIRGGRTDPNGNTWNSPVLDDWEIKKNWSSRDTEKYDSYSYFQHMASFTDETGSSQDVLSFAFVDGKVVDAEFTAKLPIGQAVLRINYTVNKDTKIGLFSKDELVWISPEDKTAGTTNIELFTDEQKSVEFTWKSFGNNTNVKVEIEQILYTWLESSSGGIGNDEINGDAKNDVINGGLGNDLINGKNGDDKLSGDGGNDVVFGGLGNDELNGGDGIDLLVDGLGNNQLNGGTGHDKLIALSGTTKISGGDGSDFIIGGFGADLLNGDDGNDIIIADATNIIGGSDILNGGKGNDVLKGGYGADFFTFNPNDGVDVIGQFKISDVVFDMDSGYTAQASNADFISGLDLIQLDGFKTVNAENTLNFISNVDGNAVFSAEGTEITFIDVLKNQLSSDDFIFS